MPAVDLLAAVADTLVPGARVEGDSALRAALAPVARAAAARRSGAFGEWPAADREALVAELLDAGGEAAAALRRVLGVAARTRYGDPASWPELGYRSMVPGTAWPPGAGIAPAPVAPDAVRDRYDVVVIGAGAGGGVAACVLAEAGHRVLLVERGASLARADLPRDHLRNARVWTGLERQVDPPPGDVRMVEDTVVAPTDPLWNGIASAVGGGTRVYGAQAWRFCPEDLRMGSVYGPPYADWPIAYEDLEPYYDQVEWAMGVCGPAGVRPHDGPRRRGYPMPPIAANAAEPVLARGAAALGMEAAAPPLLINSVPYDGRPACIRCGTCVGFACHADAKNGTDATLIPRALATGNCDLLTGTVATGLLMDRARVTGAALAPVAGGGARTVRARHVVVAAGAIETARLLLASRVGAAHDQVGRYLQGHVYAGAVGRFDEVVQDCVGPGPSISTTDFRHGNDGVCGGGILANEFVPTPIEAWGKLSGLGIVPAWGRAGAVALQEAYPRTQLVVGPIQEAPSPEARVTLAAVTDPRGVPVARLHGAPPAPQDVRAAEFLGERAADWLRAGGARRADALKWALPKGPSAGQHQAGTCRMGTDPRTSATDPWGRVWGHDGVTVADGALHVTNGGVNPVLTILANAWRVSERLAGEL